MKWIIGTVAGLALAAVGVVLALSLGEAGGRVAFVAAQSVATAPQPSSGAPDTSAAERAGCERLRDLGSGATLGDWEAAAITLSGTRLGREAVVVVELARADASRAEVYGAVLDVLEGCLTYAP